MKPIEGQGTEPTNTAGADALCKLLWAQNSLKLVRDHITPEVAPRVAARIRSLLKSVEGAIRHAQRTNAAKVSPEVTV